MHCENRLKLFFCIGNLREMLTFGLVSSKVCIRYSRCPCNHSHKKRKDSLQTRAVLLIFSPELEILGVAVRSIHQNSKKMATFARNCSVNITFRLFQPLSIVMLMAPRLLRKFRRSLPIKKSIANAPCVL